MRILKKKIFLIILFMIIGFAVVSTNVVINMSTPINKNSDDFLVYFSDVKVDGIQDLSLVSNERKLVFSDEFTAVGDKKVITYDVTNASANYDADISINCTDSTNYIKVTNSFDTNNFLSARGTKTGTLTIELFNAVKEEKTQEITCILTGNAVERTTLGNGVVAEPLEQKLISFNIYQFGTYYSELGMTWRQWIESEYNVDGFSITSVGLEDFDEAVAFNYYYLYVGEDIYAGGELVNVDDAITVDGNYYFIDGLPGMS